MRLAHTIPFTPVSILGNFCLVSLSPYFLFITVVLLCTILYISWISLHLFPCASFTDLLILCRRWRGEHLLSGGSALWCWPWIQHSLLLVVTRPVCRAAAPLQWRGLSGRGSPAGLQGAVYLGRTGRAQTWSGIRGQSLQTGGSSCLAEILPW